MMPFSLSAFGSDLCSHVRNLGTAFLCPYEPFSVNRLCFPRELLTEGESC